MKKTFLFRALCVLLFLSVCTEGLHSAELSEPKYQVSFLSHLRKHRPEIYAEFITRFNAREFFLRQDKVLEALQFDMAKSVDLERFTITRPGIPQDDPLESEKILKFLQPIMNLQNDPNQITASLKESLIFSNHQSSLMTVLATSPSTTHLRALLKLDASTRLVRLEKELSKIEKIVGFQPEKLGLSPKEYSGEEFYSLLKKSSESQAYTAKLILLKSLLSMGKITTSTQHNSLKFELSNVSRDEVKAQMQLQLEGFYPKKIAAGLCDQLLKSIEVEVLQKPWPKREEEAFIVKLIEADPLIASLRGNSASDSASKNSYGQSFAPNEKTFWVENKSQKIIGYVQGTIVENGFYLHTISGRITTDQSLAILESLVTSKIYGQIFLPGPIPLKQFINSPEIFHALSTEALLGPQVQLRFLDLAIRNRLQIFSKFELDDPLRNQTAFPLKGIRHASAISLSRSHERFVPKSYLNNIEQHEALLIALELSSLGQDPSEILFALNIQNAEFSKMINILRNRERVSSEEFKRRAKVVLSSLIPEGKENELDSLEMLADGFLNASDSVSSSNIELTLRTIERRFATSSNSKIFYSNLKRILPQLQGNSKFQNLVHALFRRNLNEMGRALYHVDRIKNSARTVLIHLVEAGMNLEPYKDDIATLLTHLEDSKKFIGVNPPSTVLILRKTLYCFALKFDTSCSFDLVRLSGRLNQLTTTEKAMLANALNAMIEVKHSDNSLVSEVNNMLLTTQSGLELITPLLLRSSKQLSSQKLIDRLLSEKKFNDAAHLLFNEYWGKQDQAKSWLTILWANRSQIDLDRFFEVFSESEEWRTHAEAKNLLSSLTKLARTSYQQKSLVEIFSKQKTSLSQTSIAWLKGIQNKELVAQVLKTRWAATNQKIGSDVQKLLAKKFGISLETQSSKGESCGSAF